MRIQQVGAGDPQTKLLKNHVENLKDMITFKENTIAELRTEILHSESQHAQVRRNSMTLLRITSVLHHPAVN